MKAVNAFAKKSAVRHLTNQNRVDDRLTFASCDRRPGYHVTVPCSRTGMTTKNPWRSSLWFIADHFGAAIREKNSDRWLSTSEDRIFVLRDREIWESVHISSFTYENLITSPRFWMKEKKEESV